MIKDNGEFSESFIFDSSNGSESHSYFEQLGISKSILEEYVDPLTEASRKNTFSVVEGKNNEVIIFGEVIDTLSFLQLLQLNEHQNSRTLITLNSATDFADFINNYQNFRGKIFLCLNCSTNSNALTQKIKAELKMPSIKDIRSLYGIIEGKKQTLMII